MGVSPIGRDQLGPLGRGDHRGAVDAIALGRVDGLAQHPALVAEAEWVLVGGAARTAQAPAHGALAGLALAGAEQGPVLQGGGVPRYVGLQGVQQVEGDGLLCGVQRPMEGRASE